MNKAEIKKEIGELSDEGTNIFLQEIKNIQPELLKTIKGIEAVDNIKEGPIHQQYQNWYSKCIGVVRSLMPERLQEFVSCYEPDSKRKVTQWDTYTIKDYLLGMVVTRGFERVFEPFGVFTSKMQLQITIIHALYETFDRRLANIEGVLQADLFGSELEASSALAKSGHFRAAGALAGVILEAQLKNYSNNKGIKISKKDPTISDFNQALKDADIFDTPTWRRMQHLGDIRNLCVHSKEREPTKDEIQDLVSGVRKYVAELN